jgi:hypothetical protein
VLIMASVQIRFPTGDLPIQYGNHRE